MPFSLDNWKKYAGQSASNTADDSLVVETIAPSAMATISQILSSAKATPAKAVGSVQVQREATNNNEIIITPLHNFLTETGLRYKPTSQVNITIPADKSEQNIECQSLSEGYQFNHLSGLILQSIPDIPQVKLLSLGFARGQADFEFPEGNPQVDLSVFYLTTFYYENRSFLKRGLKTEVMNTILGLLAKSRNDSQFIPQGEMANAQ